MRGVISYVLAGVVVMLAIDMIAPPVGLGVAVFAWPGANENALVQNVNRTRGEQGEHSQRYDRLQHHQRFPPSRQHGHVRGRECGARVESKKQIIQEVWRPNVLP
jgi:hypothetical protein